MSMRAVSAAVAIPLALSLGSCGGGGGTESGADASPTETVFLADAAIECESCPGWNRSQEPEKLAPRTWYVGSGGLSSILIDSGDGLILLDGGLPQTAPLIAANVRSLGYRLDDVDVMGLSHAHFDHAGGLAALQRASGARVVALPAAADALRAGTLRPDDPQSGGQLGSFPPVSSVEIIEDGWTLRMGEIELTAIATPGHTPGGTSWTWTACEDGACADVAYVDSLSPVSSVGFRFADGTADILRESAARVAAFDCDVFLAPHPQFFGFQRDAAGEGEFTCEAYARSSLEWLDRRLAEEAAP